MTDWNPSATLIGPEIEPQLAGGKVLDGFTKSLTQKLTSTVTETVDQIKVHGKRLVAGQPNSRFFVEVWPLPLVDDDENHITYVPNAAANLTGFVTINLFGSSVNVQNAVNEFTTDDSSDDAIYGDYLVIAEDSRVDFEFNSGAFPAGQRIASVRIELVTMWGTEGFGAGSTNQRSTAVSLVNGGVEYGVIKKTYPANNPHQTAGLGRFNWGELNPITKLPWTRQDILDLDSGTTRIRFKSTGSKPNFIAGIRLVIVYTGEQRVAMGTFTATDLPAASAARGWSSAIDLYKLDGSADWAKVNGTEYAIVVRPAPTADRSREVKTPISLTYFDNLVKPPDAVATGQVAFVSVFGSAVMARPKAVGKRLMPIVPIVGGATSVDAQPYAKVTDLPISDGGTDPAWTVQNAAGLTIRAARGMVGGIGSAKFQSPTDDLTLTVRRTSDNVLMGTIVFPAPFRPDLTLYPVDYRRGVAPVPFALAAGTTYTITATSSTPDDRPWRIRSLSSGAGYYASSYGGSTADLTVGEGDPAIVLEGTVDPPTDLTVTLGARAFATVGTSFPITELPTLDLAWTGTDNDDVFAYYEIQRADEWTDWQTIAHVRDETVEAFRDDEARIGVESSYRIRTVLTDGNASDWTAEAAETIPVLDRPGLFFTSNYAPDDGAAYADTSRDREFTNPQFDEVMYVPMQGRDHVVAFHPPQVRGVSFERTLIMNRLGGCGSARSVVGQGPRVYEPFSDLIWNPALPYVCVRDEAGNRWFSSVRAPAAHEIHGGPSVQHLVDIAVVEVSGTAVYVETDLPSA